MMTPPEIEEFLAEHFINPLEGREFLDNEYSLTNRGWVLGEFSNSFRLFNQAVRALEYKTEGNDCDDFAARCQMWAKTLFSAAHPDKRTTLLAGQMSYIKENQTAHRLNLFIVSRFDPVRLRRVRELLIYEPQTYSEVRLKTKEAESCYAYTF